VLGLVAAGLELPDLARRAYQEALALDQQLLDRQAAVGLARAEQYRYAVALAYAIGEAAVPERSPATSDPPAGTGPSGVLPGPAREPAQAPGQSPAPDQVAESAAGPVRGPVEEPDQTWGLRQFLRELAGLFRPRPPTGRTG